MYTPAGCIVRQSISRLSPSCAHSFLRSAIAHTFSADPLSSSPFPLSAIHAPMLLTGRPAQMAKSISPLSRSLVHLSSCLSALTRVHSLLSFFRGSLSPLPCCWANKRARKRWRCRHCLCRGFGPLLARSPCSRNAPKQWGNYPAEEALISIVY